MVHQYLQRLVLRKMLLQHFLNNQPFFPLFNTMKKILVICLLFAIHFANHKYIDNKNEFIIFQINHQQKLFLFYVLFLVLLNTLIHLDLVLHITMKLFLRVKDC